MPINLDQTQQLCDAIIADGTIQEVKRYALHLDARLVNATILLEVLPALAAELRAARQARSDLDILHADLGRYAAAADRLGRILHVWDTAAGEVGG